jgi:uncharacterized membrane protein
MDFTGKAAILAYIIAAATLLILDVAWLRVVMGPLYRAELGELMREQPALTPSVLFYLFYVVGIVVFAVMPGVSATSVLRAGLLGGLLGCLAYSTYDLTNLATLKQWPLNVAVLDIAWGTFVTSASAMAGTWVVIALGARTSVLR